jgi:hypothetical protein
MHPELAFVRVSTGSMTMATVLDELRADPEAFLRHHAVAIAGRAPDLSQLQEKRAKFELRTEGRPVFRGFQTGIAGLRSKEKERASIQFAQLPPNSNAALGPDVAEVWYVPMAADTTRMANRHTLLSGTEGPDIAFTSQLSGCTFSIGTASQDGGLIVSHIRPPQGRQPNAADYQAMRDAGSLGPMAHFFDRESRPGRTSYGEPGNLATIIGVRRRGTWRFYAQIYNLVDRRLYKVERLNA